MESKQLFIMTHKTALIIPEFGENGELFSKVLHDGAFYVVPMSPYKLIEWNLQYYGSSLRGEKDRVKAILKSTSRHPVMLSELKEIYWFPTHSPRDQKNCVWFALHHVKEHDLYDSDRCIVELYNGTKIILDMEVSIFEKRIKNTSYYKTKKEERMKRLLYEDHEKRASFLIVREGKQLNYEVKAEKL